MMQNDGRKTHDLDPEATSPLLLVFDHSHRALRSIAGCNYEHYVLSGMHDVEVIIGYENAMS